MELICRLKKMRILEDDQHSKVTGKAHHQEGLPAPARCLFYGYPRAIIDSDGEDQDQDKDRDEPHVKDTARGKEMHPAEPVGQ